MKACFQYPFSLYRRFLKREIYNIGIVHAPIHSFLNSKWRPVVHWLPRQPKSATFIADPFGIEFNEEKYLFCEYFDYRERKGRIIGKEIKESVTGDFENAIVLPIHTSYPFLFEHAGNVFCIPETSLANEVALFRMVALPSKWRKETVLLEGVPALDPSIVQFDNRWWLFYAVQRDDTIELHVSYADSVYGTWLPHAKQPVKSDSASCRPAGTPFIHEGRLYRPAQDCSRVYGERVIINEVELLSPLEFEEKVVSVVEPDRNSPYPDGLHTLSAMGNITLIDGKREKFVMVAAVKNVQKLLKDILLRFRGQRSYRKAMQNIQHHSIVFCIVNFL